MHKDVVRQGRAPLVAARTAGSMAAEEMRAEPSEDLISFICRERVGLREVPLGQFQLRIDAHRNQSILSGIAEKRAPAAGEPRIVSMSSKVRPAASAAPTRPASRRTASKFSDVSGLPVVRAICFFRPSAPRARNRKRSLPACRSTEQPFKLRRSFFDIDA